MRIFLTVVFAALLAACDPQEAKPTGGKTGEAEAAAAQAGDPVAAVRPIYDRYTESAAANDFNPPFSNALRQSYEAFQAATTDSDFSGGGIDPFVNSQDPNISNLNVEIAEAPKEGRAVLVARFTNNGRASEIFYDMILEEGQWRIDNIRAADPEMNYREMLVLEDPNAPE